MDDPSVTCLMGPTASGKTALALEWVEKHSFEIVSVDSAMIYRGMDIGTAKPSKDELAQAPHHLLDIRDPTEHYSVGAFLTDVSRIIPEIRARGKQPLLVGGTMLYFKALRDGIAVLPEQDLALRAQIDDEAVELGWPAMHAKLKAIDPVSAAKIKPNDSQRIERALEVFYLTGTPLSTLHQQALCHSREGGNPIINSFAIIPSDRSILHQRIITRVDAMLAAGFIDEVVALREQYALTPDLPSMRAVGYRQVWEYLEGRLPKAELRDRIVFATRQYAKRQLTWLRAWPNLTSLPMDSSLETP